MIPTGLRDEAVQDNITAQMLPLHVQAHAGRDHAACLLDLVRICRDSVVGCDSVALLEWQVSGHPSGLATTNPDVLTVSELQYSVADGPWAFAPLTEAFVHIEDFEYEPRWTVFAEAVAVRTQIRSAVSFRFPVGHRRLTLDFYAERSRAFDTHAVTTARAAMLHARALVLHLASAATPPSQPALLDSGKVIGTAVGMLVGRDACTTQQAYARLLQLSRVSGQRLHEVAREVIDGAAHIMPSADATDLGPARG